jgi:hypothetical protein
MINGLVYIENEKVAQVLQTLLNADTITAVEMYERKYEEGYIPYELDEENVQNA